MLNAARMAGVTPYTGGIKAALIAAGAANIPATDALALAIATAVVTELTTNGVVPALGLVAPAGGGPVTGAAVIT